MPYPILPPPRFHLSTGRAGRFPTNPQDQHLTYLGLHGFLLVFFLFGISVHHPILHEKKPLWTRPDNQVLGGTKPNPLIHQDPPDNLVGPRKPFLR